MKLCRRIARVRAIRNRERRLDQDCWRKESREAKFMDGMSFNEWNKADSILLEEYIDSVEAYGRHLARYTQYNSLWRYIVIGDPSIGGTMVSRFFECKCCKKLDLENYYDESCFRY